MKWKSTHKKLINSKFDKNKILLEFNEYEIDLILKSLWIGYNSVENEKLLFTNRNGDKQKLFYLHRLISSLSNKFFYNKTNDDYYILMSKKDLKKYKKIINKLKKRN